MLVYIVHFYLSSVESAAKKKTSSKFFGELWKEYKNLGALISNLVYIQKDC